MCNKCRHPNHTTSDISRRKRERKETIGPPVTVRAELPEIKSKVFGVPLRHSTLRTIMQGAYLTKLNRRVEEHALLYKGDIENLPADAVPLIRINSACSTGDIFHDVSCDCNWQLEEALRILDSQEGPGIVLYHFSHEGKGHGYLKKLQSYDGTMYPVPSDIRNFTHAVAILRDLGITRVRVMTNNPEKQQILRDYGIEIVEVVPVVSADPEVAKLYRYKHEVWGHALPTNLDGKDPTAA